MHCLYGWLLSLRCFLLQMLWLSSCGCRRTRLDDLLMTMMMMRGVPVHTFHQGWRQRQPTRHLMTPPPTIQQHLKGYYHVQERPLETQMTPPRNASTSPLWKKGQNEASTSPLCLKVLLLLQTDATDRSISTRTDGLIDRWSWRWNWSWGGRPGNEPQGGEGIPRALKKGGARRGAQD